MRMRLYYAKMQRISLKSTPDSLPHRMMCCLILVPFDGNIIDRAVIKHAQRELSILRTVIRFIKQSGFAERSYAKHVRIDVNGGFHCVEAHLPQFRWVNGRRTMRGIPLIITYICKI